jgi:peptidoglycan/xylan/chitin deacetylase (PgdA/CDA1 family)
VKLRLASISIDLDEVPLYASIHGLEPPAGPQAHAVYDRCLPRLAAWLDSQSIAATFFAIGRDLSRNENRRAVAALHRAGHEIANHSYHHHYDLTRRTEDEIGLEIERGSAMIERACGARPVGFRAPGYTVSDTLFDALEASGAQYDSSVFPCPSYYGLKAAALAAMKLRGRRSASMLDDPAVLRAPRQPYRVGRPYWRRGNGLLELPIGVTPFQLPYIGTSLVLGGARIARWLTKQMIGQQLINLELHGFDASDSAADGLEGLAAHRADLKRTAEDKIDALSAATRVLREARYELVTLQEAARRISFRPNR